MRIKRLGLALLVVALLFSVLPGGAFALDNIKGYKWYETRYNFESGVYQIPKGDYYLTGNAVTTTSTEKYNEQDISVSQKLQGVADKTNVDTFWYIEDCGNSYVTLKNLSTGKFLNFSSYNATTSDLAQQFRLEQNASDKLDHIMLRADSGTYFCLRKQGNGNDFYFGDDNANEMKYYPHVHSLTKQTSSPCPHVEYWHCSVCGFDFADDNVNGGNRIVVSGEHTWGVPTVVKQATAEQEGTIRYTCVDCSATRDETVSKLSVEVGGESTVTVPQSEWEVQGNGRVAIFSTNNKAIGTKKEPTKSVHVGQSVSFVVKFNEMGTYYSKRGESIAVTTGVDALTYEYSYIRKFGDKVNSSTTKSDTVVISKLPAGGKIVLCAKGEGYDGDSVKVSYTSNLTLNVTDHTWGDPTFTWSDDGKTCTAERTCTLTTCGAKQSTQLTLGGGITAQVKTPASCTAKGETTYTATAYGKTSTKTVKDIPALGHAKGQLYKSAQAATCTAEGVAYDVYQCGRTGCSAYVKVDGTVIEENAWVVNKTSHSETTEWQVDSEKKTHYHECSVCYIRMSEAGHSFTNYTNTATCTESGTKTAYCDAGCGVSDTQPTSALGHNFPDIWVHQSETTHAKICTNDSSHKLEESHEWSEATITVAPTATTEGKEEVKCVKCGFSTEITIPALGEIKGINGGILTSATDGSTDVTIDLCVGQTISYQLKHGRATITERSYSITATGDSAVTVSPNGVSAAEEVNPVFSITASSAGTTVVELKCTEAHWYDTGTDHTKFGVKVTVNVHEHGEIKGATVTSSRDATCTSAGVINYKCNNCDANYMKSIPMASHNPMDAAKEDVVEATCTVGGSYNLVIRCSECDSVLSSVHTDVEPKGHAVGTKHLSKTAATCTEDGVKYDVYNCKNGCGVYVDVNDKVVTAADWTAAKLGHAHGTLYKGQTNATCTEDGVKYDVYNCKNGCGVYVDVNDKVVTATDWTAGKLGHRSETKEAIDPTCTEVGYTAGDWCDRCQTWTSGHEVREALGHTEVIDAKVEATCTKTGLTEGKHCSVCNTVLVAQTVVEAKGHTEQTIPQVPAKCEETGLTEGKKCSVCGEILKAQEIISALGHNMQEVAGSAKEPTCTEDGKYADKSCANGCTKVDYGAVRPKLGHNPVQQSGKAATCTENGWNAYYNCSRCDALFEEEACTTAIDNLEVWKTEGGKIEPLGHDYKETVTAPTCIADGYTTHTCSRCDNTYTDSEESALGHDWVKGDVTESTCTEKGNTHYTCSRCDAPKDEAIDAKGHTEVTDEAKEPSCTETGLTEGSHCSVCKAVIVEQESIPAKGHAEVSAENAVDATCTTSGKKSDTVCSVCGTTTAVGDTIDPLGHTFETYVSDNNAACEKNRTETAKCIRCDVTDTHEVEGTALEHDSVKDEAVAPTCTATGKTEGSHCSVCNKILVAQETVPANGHTEVTDEAKEPTCTEKGLTEGKHCSVCNTVLVEQGTVAAKGHSWDTPYIEFSADGKTAAAKRVCTRDGSHVDSQTATVTAEVTTPATCSAMGTTTYTAKATFDGVEVSGTKEVQDVAIDRFAHNWEVIERKDATCSTNGSIKYRCEDCGVEQLLPVMKTGHKFGEYTSKDKATCFKDATESAECSVCGTATTRTVAGTKLSGQGHTHKFTWTKSGDTYKVTKIECAECGTSTTSLRSVKYTNGEANGHNTITAAYSDGITDTYTVHVMGEAAIVAPTCTEVGNTSVAHCTVANCTYETAAAEIPALGHSYSGEPHWKWIKMDRDNSWRAYYSQQCERCGEYGPDAEGDTTVAASGGLITYTSSVTLDGVTYFDERTVRVGYTVTVHGNDITSDHTGLYAMADPITLTSSKPKDWYMGETRDSAVLIASNTMTCKTHVTGDMVFWAEDVAAEEEQKATIALTTSERTVKADGSGIATFEVRWSVPAGKSVEYVKIYYVLTNKVQDKDSLMTKSSKTVPVKTGYGTYCLDVSVKESYVYKYPVVAIACLKVVGEEEPIWTEIVSNVALPTP